MAKIYLIIFFSPYFANAQLTIEKGIIFEQNLNWQYIKEKASEKNKYIFVDCYTSWCGPCKLMDQKVYSREEVGAFFNDNFISIKLKMDTSKEDNEEMKKIYSTADSIRRKYKVTMFPTYLFFSFEGKILHRSFGAQTIENFIKLGRNAIDSNSQYYTLLSKYQQGERNYDAMPYLAMMANNLKDKESAFSIANDYKVSYLYANKTINLFEKNTIEFICLFMENSKEKGFQLFYQNCSKIDEIVGIKGYSKAVISKIITNEEIDPLLWPLGKPVSGHPNWKKMKQVIAKKYNKEYAENTTLEAQLRWYTFKQQWPEIIRYSVYQIEKNGIDTAGVGSTVLNNFVYDIIFMHSNDKKILEKGVMWIEKIIKDKPNTPEYIDTYANLLYKLGRVKEAISFEEKASKLDPKEKIYKETLEKIKRREPTWQ